MTHIIVVGSANVDLVVRTPHIPRAGETVLGGSLVTALGGKGANQAVGAARLGAKVTLVACVGQDHFGAQCVEGYRAERIITSYVRREADESTGVALIAVDAEGENSIVVASGANMMLAPSDVEGAASVFEDADVLLMQLEVPLETVLAAARLARDHHVRVILNPAPARQVPAELLQYVDVLTPNRIELAQLAALPEETVRNMPDEEVMKRLLGLGVPSGVITLGAEGALAGGSWGVVRIPGFEVQAVDTTAAGDAFNAGLAVALGSGQSLAEATRFACACGALAATKLGAQPSLPVRAAVDHLLG